MSPKVIIWGLIALWVAALTVHDWRTRRVPNWAVYPLLPAAFLIAIVWPIQGPYGWTELLFLALGVLACGTIWFMRLLSGGDVKLALPLVILLPYPEFYMTFLAVGVVGGLLMLTLWNGGSGWSRFQALVATTWVSQRLPRASETRAAAAGMHPPATWILGVPSVLFIGWSILFTGM